MNVNSVIFGQVLFLLNLIVISLTIYYAAHDKKALPGTVILALLINFIFPPLGWYYLWRKMNARKQAELKEGSAGIA